MVATAPPANQNIFDFKRAIEQLLSLPRGRPLNFGGKKIDPQDFIEKLKTYLKQNPILRTFLKKYGEETEQKISLADLEAGPSKQRALLQSLVRAMGAFDLEQEQKQAQIAAASRPAVSQLKQWQEALARAKINQQQQQEITIVLPHLGDLQQQIDLIRNFQTSIKKTAAKTLDLDLEKKEKVETLAQREKQRLDQQEGQALEEVSFYLYQATSEKGEPLTSEEVGQTIDNLCQENPLAAAVLSPKKETLVKDLTQEFSANQETIEKVAGAQEKLDQVAILSAPNLAAIVKSEYGLSDKKSARFVSNLYTNWPDEIEPSPAKVELAIRQTMAQTFGVGDWTKFNQMGITEKQAAQQLSLFAVGHYKNLALFQLKQTLEPPRLDPKSWLTKIIKEHQLDPTLLSNWLKDIDLAAIPRGIKNLLAPEQKQRLNELEGQTQNFAENINQLPFFTRWRLVRIKRRINTRISRTFILQRYFNALTKLKKLKPLQKFVSTVIHPRKHVSRLFYNASRNLARRGVRILEGSGLRLLRNTSGSLLVGSAAAFRLASKMILIKNPVAYANYKLRNFAIKTAAKVVAGVIGLSVGKVTNVLTIGVNLVRFFKSAEGKEILRKINPFNYDNVLRLAIGVGKFLLAHPGMLAGAALGGAIGSVVPFFGTGFGMVAGGFIGYFVGDQFLIPLFRGGQTLLADLGAGATTQAAAGQAGLMAPVAETAAAAEAAGGILAKISAAYSAIGVPIMVGGTTLIITLNTSVAFLNELGPGPPMPEYEQDTVLSVDKSARPGTVSGPGQTVTYTIDVVSQDGGLNNVIVTDVLEDDYLTIIPDSFDPPPSQSEGNQYVWGQYQGGFTDPGSSLPITYQATTNPGVHNKTQIRNTVTVTATNAKGEEIKRIDSVTLNSTCDDIKNKAEQIMNNLVKVASPLCNSSVCRADAKNRGYQNLFNCPMDSDWSQFTGHECVYCNNLVTIAYTENGRNNPIGAFRTTAEEWEKQGILRVKNGRLVNPSQGTIPSQISEGDVIFFDVGQTSFRHTGLVCRIENGNVCACEANTVATQINSLCYSFSGNSFDGKGTVRINAIGDTCQE